MNYMEAASTKLSEEGTYNVWCWAQKDIAYSLLAF